MIKGHPFLTGCYKSTCPENSINQANHYYLFVRGLDKDCPKASDVFLCFHILQHVLKRLEMAMSPADKALHSGRKMSWQNIKSGCIRNIITLERQGL